MTKTGLVLVSTVFFNYEPDASWWGLSSSAAAKIALMMINIAYLLVALESCGYEGRCFRPAIKTCLKVAFGAAYEDGTEQDDGFPRILLLSSVVEVFVQFASIPLLYETDDQSWLCIILGCVILSSEGMVLFLLWCSGDEDVEACGRKLTAPDNVAKFGNEQLSNAVESPVRSPIVVCHMFVFVMCAAYAAWVVNFGGGFPSVNNCEPGYYTAMIGQRCKAPIICSRPTDTTGYVFPLVESNLDASLGIDLGPAICADGYIGTPTASNCIGRPSPYFLSGCSISRCTSPPLPVGYDIDERRLTTASFDVRARCALGFVGSAVVAPCETGGMAYGISGCSEDEMCSRPSDMVGYVVVSETNLGLHDFRVRVGCASMYHGNPEATVCGSPGADYSLEGCRPDVCKKPDTADGYDHAPETVGRADFDVAPSCADTYQGTAVASTCDGHNHPYTLAGCARCPRVAAYYRHWFSANEHKWSVYCCSEGEAGERLSEESYGTNYNPPATVASDCFDGCPTTEGGRCVTSRNFGDGGPYDSSDGCSISASKSATLSTTAFNVETGSDILTIGEERYGTSSHSSSTGPQQKSVDSETEMIWDADWDDERSGWKLCVDQDSSDEYHSLFYREDIGGPQRAACCSGMDLLDSDPGDIADDVEATSTCGIETPTWEGGGDQDCPISGWWTFLVIVVFLVGLYANNDR